MIRPIVVMDKDALVDEGMTDEERVAHTELACRQLLEAGYFPMLVNAGARVEVVGVGRPGAESAKGETNILRVDWDSGIDEETWEKLEQAGWIIVEVKPGSAVQRV